MARIVRSIDTAVAKAGRFGHVQSTGKVGNDHTFMVRSGVGKWLVHVVKWHTNRTYRDTVIQQRKELLAVLEQSSHTGKSTGDSPAQVRQLQDHLTYGITFQKQVMNFLGAVEARRKAENSPSLGAGNSVTEERPANRYATNDAALVNLRILGHDGRSHLDVDVEKFGTAYWKYASAKLGNSLGSSVKSDPEAAAGHELLTYALAKDGDEHYQDTGLYQVEVVSRSNDEGINFEAWGIPNEVDKIELRFISGPLHAARASNVASVGAEGREALEEFCKTSKIILDFLPEGSEERKIHMKSRGTDLQLAKLQDQFLKEEAGSSAPD